MDLYDDDFTGDGHWAFGTGFRDPLDGVPMTPASPELAERCLALGDDALVMSHRIQEWCTRAPELEDEVALANIALDLLGQARLLLARTGRDEDALAFHREAAGFRNVRLAEVRNGDFAHLVVRLLVFSTWRLAVLERLRGDPDPVLAAIADKGVKEVAYHRDYAARWTIMLGDGTEHSRERMERALADLWPLVGELFTRDPDLRAGFDAVIGEVLARATLKVPAGTAPPGPRGDDLAELLAEMQGVARSLPEATW
ncbi:1,2-phenylacetyl-CoA epoxidase subunit PaaC [Actinomadura macrotermitis]|uniref:1,2-phenylacetyl-CoA epoxidase, subunit C n=1 Tax=Actinomadura macrotermitis TaxID=2585200 RepID=A0A7K0C6Z4_9ACTN|nr:1,2-phenylacetyl-CoA epoxidase subunit PaaC [Actinomadura macrotermitis]MQY09205.1 1,2-phenylacetyl-CoA epoxidase, subunit C [Actinomadura macrotermitis]